MNRRDFLTCSGAAMLGLAGFPAALAAAPRARKRHVLCFTKSASFEHSVVRRTGGKLSLAEQTLTDLGVQHGFDVTCTKDDTVFTPDNLARYDAFYFYTTGDLTTAGTDGNPPMSAEGKAAFLDAIHNGKGFIGTHSATDTFHTPPDDRYVNYGEHVDPYIEMIGAEFIRHDAQQKARMRIVDPRFPGFADRAVVSASERTLAEGDSNRSAGSSETGSSFELLEEWYSLKDFRKNLHVLLIQDTAGMKGTDYQRPPYPATWARMHGRGRVFYTSMGHREDVWANPLFQSILLGGIAWATGSVRADVTPNIESVCAGAWELPPRPARR